MAHFAQIDNTNTVIQVIVAEQDFIDSGAVGDPTKWIQTSYNTQGGIHTQGGTPLRKNYAGVGYTYDLSRDAFIPPQSFPSWLLDEESCLWEAPVAYPGDEGIYRWDEDTLSWVLAENQE